MALKKLFNNDLQDGFEIHETLEDAHLASIGDALRSLKDITADDNGYIKDITPSTDLDAIAKAAKNIQLAIKGKFISVYNLDEA